MRSQIIKTTGEPVKVDYVMRRSGDLADLRHLRRRCHQGDMTRRIDACDRHLFALPDGESVEDPARDVVQRRHLRKPG